MTTTGARLKKCREYLNLSQEDIAGLIGSSAAYISLVENNKSRLSVDNLVKLLLKYNINLNYLLAGIGSPFIPSASDDIKEKVLNEVNSILVKYGIKNG